MKRIIPCLAVAAALAVGGPHILSNAVQQLGGPQLQTGQALAQKLSRCGHNYRMVGRRVCRPVYEMRCETRFRTRRCRRVRVGVKCSVRNVVTDRCRPKRYHDSDPKIRTGG